MNVLKALRKNESVNKLMRVALRWGSKTSNRFFNYIIFRWRPSGTIDCEFNNVRFKLYSECDDGFPSYFYYGLKYHEEADLNLFIELAKNSDCILDIGANIGLFSILAAKVNPASSIHAFEPYYANAERMKTNLHINNIKNVHIVQQAIGEIRGEIEMAVPKDKRINDAASVNKKFSELIYPELLWDNVTVNINTIDNYSATLPKPADLIKCDVESYEMSVFKGAGNVLLKDKPTILFECFPDDERILFFNSIIKEYSYYVYLILEQGVVYCHEGITKVNLGLNYLMTPVKPERTFISYKDTSLAKELLLRPTHSA